MSDVISQAAYAPYVRPAVDALATYAAATAHEEDRTTLLPPMRIGMEGLQRLIAAIEDADPQRYARLVP